MSQEPEQPVAPALIKAAAACDLAAAIALLHSGAAVDVEDADGRTPLWWAAQARCQHLVGVLLDAGADPFHRAHDGETPAAWISRMLAEKPDAGEADVLRRQAQAARLRAGVKVPKKPTGRDTL